MKERENMQQYARIVARRQRDRTLTIFIRLYIVTASVWNFLFLVSAINFDLNYLPLLLNSNIVILLFTYTLALTLTEVVIPFGLY